MVETIEMLVEDGFNYGSPNIKMIDCITIYENGDYVTERHFYVNGYKFRMDELMKCSMKRYLMSVIPQFRGKEDVDKLLTQSISYKAGSDAPQYLKDRMKQQTTLVRGLIKALKDSNDINAELTAISATANTIQSLWKRISAVTFPTIGKLNTKRIIRVHHIASDKTLT